MGEKKEHVYLPVISFKSESMNFMSIILAEVKYHDNVLQDSVIAVSRLWRLVNIYIYSSRVLLEESAGEELFRFLYQRDNWKEL